MFTQHQQINTIRYNHLNKPFYRIAVCSDPTNKSKVFAVEDYRTICLFYNLNEQEEKQLIQAIKLFDTNEFNWNLAENVVLTFLEKRYKQGGKESEQLDFLIKQNRYYEKKFVHFSQLQKSMSDGKEYVSLNPDKRKELTSLFRESDGAQGGFAPDVLLQSLNPSQNYNRTPTPTTGHESKQDSQELPIFFTRTHATFFPRSLSRAPSPLNQRSKGGMLVLDSLDQTFKLSTVPDPFVTPVATQDDTITSMFAHK